MATRIRYTSDSPIIVHLREELATVVDTIKDQVARIGELDDQRSESEMTLHQILSLPTNEDETDCLEGTERYIRALQDEPIAEDESRNAILFAHLSAKLKDLSEYYGELAVLYSENLETALPEVEAPMTKEDVAQMIKDADGIFRQIWEWTGDPDASGQKYKTRNTKSGETLSLDIPRIKITKPSSTSNAPATGQLFLTINGTLMNPNGEPYANAIKEAFSLTPTQFIEKFTAQGHSMKVTDAPVAFLHDGATWKVQLTR